jgi:N-methylhydantoinase B
VTVTPDQQIGVETPGAGGWGEPKDRDEQGLKADRESGKFSDAFMAENYGGGE